VRENGFGHEEWLFNFSWLQSGPKAGAKQFKYGYLQPIGKYQRAYEGNTFDTLLYTVTPSKKKEAVAIIKNLYVPRAAEVESAVSVMRRNGWIEEMKTDLSELGISTKRFTDFTEPAINVRFSPSDVTFFDPRILLPHGHKLYRIDRYQPVDWDDTFPEGIARSPSASRSERGEKRRSEKNRKRAGVSDTEYSPQHVKLQNKLYDHLCDLHGPGAVGYEQSFVDLTLEEHKPSAKGAQGVSR